MSDVVRIVPPPAPLPVAITAGDLTAHHLGMMIEVMHDEPDRGVRATGTLDKIGHDIDTLNNRVTWIGLRGPDGWRWYKQVPSVTVVRR